MIFKYLSSESDLQKISLSQSWSAFIPFEVYRNWKDSNSDKKIHSLLLGYAYEGYTEPFSSFCGGWWVLLYNDRNQAFKLIRDRDSISTSLFYSWHNGTFHLAQDIFQIIEKCSPGVNFSFLVARNCRGEFDINETSFEGVYHLPGGHQYNHVSGTSRLSKYWNPDKGNKLKPHHDPYFLGQEILKKDKYTN